MDCYFDHPEDEYYDADFYDDENGDEQFYEANSSGENYGEDEFYETNDGLRYDEAEYFGPDHGAWHEEEDDALGAIQHLFASQQQAGIGNTYQALAITNGNNVQDDEDPEEIAYQAGYDDGLEDGYENGYNDVCGEAYDAGYNDGFDENSEQAYWAGYDDANQAAQEVDDNQALLSIGYFQALEDYNVQFIPGYRTQSVEVPRQLAIQA